MSSVKHDFKPGDRLDVRCVVKLIRPLEGEETINTKDGPIVINNFRANKWWACFNDEYFSPFIIYVDVDLEQIAPGVYRQPEPQPPTPQ